MSEDAGKKRDWENALLIFVVVALFGVIIVSSFAGIFLVRNYATHSQTNSTSVFDPPPTSYSTQDSQSVTATTKSQTVPSVSTATATTEQQSTVTMTSTNTIIHDSTTTITDSQPSSSLTSSSIISTKSSTTTLTLSSSSGPPLVTSTLTTTSSTKTISSTLSTTSTSTAPISTSSTTTTQTGSTSISTQTSSTSSKSMCILGVCLSSPKNNAISVILPLTTIFGGFGLCEMTISTRATKTPPNGRLGSKYQDLAVKKEGDFTNSDSKVNSLLTRT